MAEDEKQLLDSVVIDPTGAQVVEECSKSLSPHASGHHIVPAGSTADGTTSEDEQQPPLFPSINRSENQDEPLAGSLDYYIKRRAQFQKTLGFPEDMQDDLLKHYRDVDPASVTTEDKQLKVTFDGHVTLFL